MSQSLAILKPSNKQFHKEEQKMKIKNIAIAGLLALGVGATSFTVYAQANYDNPREALSAMTGKTMEEIHDLRQTEGVTKAELFNSEADYKAFQDEVLEQRKERVQERVENGNLTQERADEILTRMQDGTFKQDGSGLGQGENCMDGQEGMGIRNHERLGNQNQEGKGNQHGPRGNGLGLGK